MNYHLNWQGQDLGVFTLEELRRKREAGELKGTEWALAEGGSEWKALDFILYPATSGPSQPPGLPASVTGKKSKVAVIVVTSLVTLFIAGIVIVGIAAYKFVQRVRTTMRQAQTQVFQSRGTTASLASKPIQITTNSLTEAVLQQKRREFRVRHYLEGFKRDGPMNEPWSQDAVLFIESWIARNYGGDSRTNLPTPRDLGDKLVAAGCGDPLILTIAGVEAGYQDERTRRLKRAVAGYPNSNYKAYPQMFATVSLAAKLANRAKRLQELDAAALELFRTIFSDGSVLPEDQTEWADIFIVGWGQSFFERHHADVLDTVRGAGKSFEWLALTLEGEAERNEAWRARGSGWSDSVTQKGWQGFSAHLDRAEKAFTKAWKLRPDLPMPACRMIGVSMGQSKNEAMRLWFDRATAAQFDHPKAWVEYRWGLRPRWGGSHEEMLDLGIIGLNTARFDTDVPRQFLISVWDMESEMELPIGEHIYDRPNIWPNLRKMYEGYINSTTSGVQAYWRGDYASVAYMAGRYDTARKALEELNWEMPLGCGKHWGRDLSAMPWEVAARTGSLSREIAEAESAHSRGEMARALQLYSSLRGATNADERTRRFIQMQTALIEYEQRLEKGDWVDFLPTDEKDDNWMFSWGKPVRVTPNALELEQTSQGHLLYSRANIGENFEVRGQFDVVKADSKAFQAGLVMGMPDYDTRFTSSRWFAFRMKRDASEGDLALFSQGWTWNQTYQSLELKETNSFLFHFEDMKATATVNGYKVFRDAALREIGYKGDTFLVGLCAFTDSDPSVIRYRNLQIRRLLTVPRVEKKENDSQR